MALFYYSLMYSSPTVRAVRFPDCSRQRQLAVLTEFGHVILKRGASQNLGVGVYVRFEKSTFNIILEFLFTWKYCCFHTTNHRMQGWNLLVGWVRESLMAEGMQFSVWKKGSWVRQDWENWFPECHSGKTYLECQRLTGRGALGCGKFFLSWSGCCLQRCVHFMKTNRALSLWLVHSSVCTSHFNKKCKEKQVVHTLHTFSMRWDKA